MNDYQEAQPRKPESVWKTVLVVYVLFLIIGLAVSFVPFILTKMTFEEEVAQIRQEGCTETVYAVVIRNDAEEFYDEDSGTYTAYAPVYKYNGETYEIKSSFGSADVRYQPGTETKLMIDPEDPGHIYDPSARSAVNGAYLLTLIFPAVTLVGGICAGIILCIVRKVLQKPQKDERGGIQ